MKEQELIDRLDSLPMENKPAFIVEAIESYPSYMRFKNRLANLYITNGELLKAKNFLEKELAKQYNIHLQITLSHLELKCNSLVAARKTIELLRKNNPNTPHGYSQLGRLNKKEGNKEAAIAAFKEAHNINPKITGPVLELFDFYIKDRKLDDALSIIESGIKYQPDNYFFLMRYAQVWSGLGNLEKAWDEYRKARNLATNETQIGNAALHLAIVNKDQISVLETIKKLRIFSDQYPSHVGLKLNLIRFLTNAKLYPEALIEIENMQQLAPDDLRGLASKATIYQRRGLTDKSEQVCDQILSKNPTQLNSILLKANLLRLREETEDAFKLYQKGIEAHPISPWPYAGMAQLLYQEGSLDEAINILEEGTIKANNIKPLKQKHIQFLMNAGEFTKALSLIEKYRKEAVAFDPQSLHLEMQLFQRQGNFQKAKDLAQDLLKVSSKDSTWEIKALSFLSATAFLEYDYITSEKILSDLVERAEDANMMRNRLSLLYLLKGDLFNAQKQLRIATQEIESKETSGRVLIPLIGHTAKVLNELQINPRLKSKAVESFKYTGKERLNYLAELNTTHPDYFGFSLYLTNELRAQGVLDHIKESVIKSKNEQKIPKTIIQYWDSGTPPNTVKRVMDSWRRLNPDYEYRLFSRKSAYHFLRFQYGTSDAQAFLNCEHPAMQADFFRLAYLSKLGGFYSDADDKCVKSLDNIVDSGAELVLKLGDFGCISNNFLGCAPRNEIINDAYNKGIKNMTTYFNEGPWFRLGPGHLTKSVSYMLSKYVGETDFSKWPQIYTLDQIETREYLSQHLSLPYKSSDKSWFTAEYRKTITKTKSA